MNYYHYIVVGPYAAGKTTALASLSELSFTSIQNKIAEHQALSISLTLPDIEHAICKLGIKRLSSMDIQIKNK